MVVGYLSGLSCDQVRHVSDQSKELRIYREGRALAFLSGRVTMVGNRKIMNYSDHNCTLLVSSCDRYADLWGPYFCLLRTHWPDCPFPVALITESKRPALPNVRPLCLGTGFDWSTLLRRALDAVSTPYVLFTLEDFFMRRQINTSRITALFDDFTQSSLRMLRLASRPGPTIHLEHMEYGGIEPSAAYRVSMQAAFWSVDTLRQLLVSGETAWEFEINASVRSAEMPGFVAVWQDALPYRHHVIERGKWFPWDYWKFRRMNIGVDPTARSVMTAGETSRWIIGKIFEPLVLRVPMRLRRVLSS